jgi:hypothetical protein
VAHTLLQLNPPLPVETPKGPGLAHVLIDYGIEHDLLWVVFIDHTGECWTVRNREVRAVENWTAGRGRPHG